MSWWVIPVAAGLFCWALAEATIWPVMPDLALFMVVLFAPDFALIALAAVSIGSAIGGSVGITLLRRGLIYPRPLTTARMEEATKRWLERGPGGLVFQLATAVPYKVFVVEAARRGFGRWTWAALTTLFRGARMALVTALALATDLAVRWFGSGGAVPEKLSIAAVAGVVFLVMWRIAYVFWSRPAQADS